MRFRTQLIILITALLLSCKSQYRIVEMNGTIVEMNSTFDQYRHDEMHKLVNSYKSILDEMMNEVIGSSQQQMHFKRPESLLTNLTSDVMKEYGDEHLQDGADLSIMNLNGHRSTMPKGKITIGNIYEIYPFENQIVFLKLKGKELNKIFDAYARMGGAGISSNAKLVIKRGKIISATVDGKKIENSRVYNVVTLDYLADGNDNMSAFRNALSMRDSGITLRDVMIDWIREKSRQGREIESALDGRIIVKN